MTPYQLAEAFRGIEEVPGSGDNSQIIAMLHLDAEWPEHDEVPWCSAFPNYICWMLKLPRSYSLMARSWLSVGWSVPLEDANVGPDIVVLSRGDNPRLGHVGFYSGHNGERIYILGGNQGNGVDVSGYDVRRVLDIRRLK